MDNNPEALCRLAEKFRNFGLEIMCRELYEYMRHISPHLQHSQDYQEALHRARQNLQPDLLAYYVGRIKPRLLEAFILGKATVWSYQDPIIEAALQGHALVQAPMIYINVICRKRYSPCQNNPFLIEQDEYAGYSVSVEELDKILREMRNYIDLNRPAGDEVNQIDTAVNKEGAVKTEDAHKFLGNRRFLPSQRAHDTIRGWINQVQSKVVNQARTDCGSDPTKLSKPMEWCFQEVGFARKGISRGSHHLTQEGTNYLLGLFYATLCYCYKDQFEMKQYRWSYVAEPEHANFLEIIGSILCGTYGFSAKTTSFGIGLNPTYAGGVAMSGPHALTDEKYRPGFLFAQKQLVESKAWDEHLKHTSDALASIEASLDKQEKISEMKKEIEVTKAKTQKIAEEAHAQVKSRLLSSVAALKAQASKQQQSSIDDLRKRKRGDNDDSGKA